MLTFHVNRIAMLLLALAVIGIVVIAAMLPTLTRQAGSASSNVSSSSSASPATPTVSLQSLSSATTSCYLDVANRETIVQAATRKASGLPAWPDGSIGVLRTGSTYVFFGPNGHPGGGRGSATIARSVGTLDNPVARMVQPNITVQNLKDHYDYVNGGHVYSDPTTGMLLMFYHAEKWPQGYSQVIYGLYGMAKSTDGGETWTDLGEIVTPQMPYQDQIPAGVNPSSLAVPMPGAPYVVAGNYFYVYFKDRASSSSPTTWLAVARAPVAQVVQAALHNDTVVDWSKYYDGNWNEPGLGGRASSLEVGNPQARWYDVSYNDYLHEYLMITSASSSATDTELYQVDSPDGLNWGARHVVEEDFGSNFYPTIVGLGNDTRITGSQFYVYYARSNIGYAAWDDATLVRRLVSCQQGPKPSTSTIATVPPPTSNGPRVLTGRVTDASGNLIPGAKVNLTIRPSNGPGAFTKYNMPGVVPTNAKYAVINLNFLRQDGGTGPVNFTLYGAEYTQAGDKAQRVPNWNFSGGIQKWSHSGGGSLTLRPSDQGTGNMLQVTATPAETGYVVSARFNVTAGADYQAVFLTRVSPASIGSGNLDVDFLDQSSSLLTHQRASFSMILGATYPTVVLAVDTTGSVTFNLGPLTPYSVDIYMVYIGSANYWPSETRLTS